MERTANALSNEDRVRLIVSGTFTRDSLGDDYQRTLDELRADPQGHLRAFARMFLQQPVSPAMLTELQLPKLLQLTLTMLPDETRRVAQALADRMGASARAREAAFLESDDEATTTEIQRGRQLLDQRRYDLQQLLH